MTSSMKTHARRIPIVAVGRPTVRATDGLQTTITCSPVNLIDQTPSLDLSLGISLPMPPQDEPLPDQIEPPSIRPVSKRSGVSSKP